MTGPRGDTDRSPPRWGLLILGAFVALVTLLEFGLIWHFRLMAEQKIDAIEKLHAVYAQGVEKDVADLKESVRTWQAWGQTNYDEMVRQGMSPKPAPQAY